jgi:hypothetical protein
MGVLVGQVCHIKASSPGGPRYDPSQTPEERDGYENLIHMCAAHNKIIDHPSTAIAFTVEMIEGYKREHEKKSHNVVVKENVLAQFLSILIHRDGLLPRSETVLSDAAIDLLLEATKRPERAHPSI